MKTFSDNAGRLWVVSLNIDTVKRVRSLLEVDLLQVVEGKLLERLVADPVLLCDILFVICKTEADARNVTDEDFGRGLAGDAIDAATKALLEELVDFFPLGKRRLLGKALEKLRTLEARALTLAEQRLDSPELEKKVAAILDRAEMEPTTAVALPETPISGN